MKHPGGVERWLPLVNRVACSIHRRLPKTVDVKDLEQDGSIGLMAALKSFDPARGVKFRTFATLKIRGAILDGLRDRDWVPRRAREREEHVPLIASFSAVLWEQPDGRHDKVSLEDQIAHHSPTADRGVADRDLVETLMTGLKPMDRQAITRYFLDGVSMGQIAVEFGLSESRISQRITRAKAFMRSKGVRLGIETDSSTPVYNRRVGTSQIRPSKTCPDASPACLPSR